MKTEYILISLIDSFAALSEKTVGGEWAVLGLARSGYAVPDSYYENYYRTVEKYVRDKKGVLHDVKYTEYSRVILGLTADGFVVAISLSCSN